MINNEEHFDKADGPQSSGGGNKLVWIVVVVMAVICIAVGVLSSVLTAYFMRRGTTPPIINTEERKENITAVVSSRKPAITEVVCGGLRGSGVCMRYEKGKVYVLTNAHVLGIESADDVVHSKVVVRFYNEDDGYPADVVGYSSLYDIALLSVSHGEVYIIDTPEIFIRSLDYSEGDVTVAIGNAMGLGISAYDGIISKASDVITSNGKNVPVMRTTSAINAGMSGGALFDMEGRFLGLNTYRMSVTDGGDIHDASKDVEDTGFVTPVSIVYAVYNRIYEYGNGGEIGGLPVISYYGSTGTTSVGGMTVTVIGAKAGTFTAEIRKGLLTVSAVDTVSPIAGMQVGDVIEKIGSTEIKAPYDLCRAAGELLRYRYMAADGEKLALSLSRDGHSSSVEIDGYFGYVG